MNSPRMSNALINLLCIFLYFSSSSEIIKAIMLKLPDIYSSFDFEILFWSTNSEIKTFKIDSETGYDCSSFPAFLG